MKYNQLIFPILLLLSRDLIPQVQAQYTSSPKSLLCEIFPHLCETQTPSSSPSDSPSESPSESPSSSPTSSPSTSYQPSFNPSQKPTDSPTKSNSPSVRPSQNPTINPTSKPTSIPSTIPSSKPSIGPSSMPSANPTDQPSVLPSHHPTLIPSTSPTSNPSSSPSIHPTDTPSSLPSTLPSTIPSSKPSIGPSSMPSTNPTDQPSVLPSHHPTPIPSNSPTSNPSSSPSIHPTDTPSSLPSTLPSLMPSISPTSNPTFNPSITPSAHPTVHHSSQPSSIPSSIPSISPTITVSPTVQPTSSPTLSSQPSSTPSSEPSTTTSPSTNPTHSPTLTTQPTTHPSNHPTTLPSSNPTIQHSQQPSTSPSNQPSLSQSPSSNPTVQPTSNPSNSPSSSPSNDPSLEPSIEPSNQPSNEPSESPTSSPTFGPRPNLIMVLTDEHNLRTLGCYRKIFKNKKQDEQAHVWGDGVEVETPNIDRLASEGAIFTNFYTVAPLCTPSRASFMSGLYPQRTGAHKNHGRMNDDIVTFAEILESQRGYYTGYGGKWHLNGDAKPGWSETSADSENRKFGFSNSTYLWNRGHWKFLENDNGVRKEYEFSDQDMFSGREDEHFTTDYLFDRSIEFMRVAKARNEPFAYVLSIPDPHAPNEVRQPYEDMYKHMHFQLPKSAKKAVRRNPATPTWNYNDHGDISLEDAEQYLIDYENDVRFQNHLQQYFAMVKCVDDNFGKMLDFLDLEGLADNTLVIFTSDHGDLLGEHGKMNKGRPFRTSAGIPFILRYPGKVLEGKKIHSALTSVDFAPTILSLMGVENHGGINFDGIDFSNEVLSSYTTTNYPRTRFTFDSNDNAQWAAVMRRQLRLVVSKTDSPWLFDLAADPYEVENFFDLPKYEVARNNLIEHMKAALHEYDIPLKNAPFIFWSSLSCSDSPDRIQIDGVKYTCEDLGESLPIEQCASNQDVRTHCAVSCNSCCRDSVGEIWMRGETYTCGQLQNKCNKVKVQNFCPQTCGQCSTPNTLN